MHFYLNIRFPCKSAQRDNPGSSNYTVCHSLLAQLGLSFRLVYLGSTVSYFLGLIEEKQQVSQRIPRPGCFPLGMLYPLDRGAFPLPNQRFLLFTHYYSYTGEEGNSNMRFTSLKASLLMTNICF